MALAGAVYGGAADREAERAGRERERLMTRFELRGLSREARMMEGATRAGAAGGGVVATKGSVLTTLAEQREEFARDIRQTQAVGAANIRTLRAEGKARRRAYAWSAAGEVASSAVSAIEDIKMR